MKVCPKCGRWYEDDGLLNCKKDGVELQVVPDAPLQLSDDELRRRRKKDWIWLIVGVPAFMLFLYGMYYILAMLMPR